jgi:hypothetical protein
MTAVVAPAAAAPPTTAVFRKSRRSNPWFVMVVSPRGRKSFVGARMLLLPWVGKARFGLLLRRSLMAGRLFSWSPARSEPPDNSRKVSRERPGRRPHSNCKCAHGATRFLDVAIFDSRSARANEANVTVEITEDHVSKSRHHMPVIVQKSLVT